MAPVALDVRPEIASALQTGQAVVALESTLIAHGLPWPLNLETARSAEQVIREQGAVPATIAVLYGRAVVGLADSELEHLARSPDVRKASRRDLASAIAKGASAATTVAATMALAHHAGIRVFATGGIGGVHPTSMTKDEDAATNQEDNESSSLAIGHSSFAIRRFPWDVSADLHELARTPVAVVCAGAKSILDLPATLEVLETLGVPVVGYGTSHFPAFYLESSELPLSTRVDTPEEAASLLVAHWNLAGAGVVLGQSLPREMALPATAFAEALTQAHERAARAKIRGPALTPFLLARLAEITGGLTLRANRALIVANARLAARIARALLQGD